MSLLEGIIVSALGSGLVSLLGWLLNTWLVREPQVFRDPTGRLPTLSQAIEFYVQQQRSRATPEPRRVITIRRTVITSSRTTQDGDDAVVIGLIALVVVAALSAFWQAYKIQLLIATVVGTALGWTSSFYFAAVLRKIEGPKEWEDHALSWGSMLVWGFGMFGFLMGVFVPAYAPEIADISFALAVAQALQVIGAASLYAAILATAIMQFAAGSIYRKAFSDRLPNRLEAWLWAQRRRAIAIGAVGLIVGVPLVSGLVTFVFPSYLRSASAAAGLIRSS